MAKLLIDTCAFGQSWAQEVLKEASSCPNVIFVESDDWKSQSEKGRMFKLVEFLKLVRQKYGNHRVEYAPTADVEAHMKKIEVVPHWRRCESCDDPHIFAIVLVKNVRFILTAERRMDDCRRKMHGHLDRAYLGFRLINSSRNFKAHRFELFASC